jgi:hypothetical protein
MLGLVILMGVLILAGTAVVAVTIIHRAGMAGSHAAPPASRGDNWGDVALGEPAGSHVVSVTTAGDRLAILIQGGGPDRVDFVDPEDGRLVGRVRLAP